MTIIQSASQAEKRPFYWPAFIQFVLSLLGIFALIGGAVAIATAAALPYITTGAFPKDPTSTFMLAASLAFAGVLVVPSAWYAWKGMASPEVEPAPRPERRATGFILTGIVIILVVGALILGNYASKNTKISWYVLPLLNIVATGLPTLWMVYIGTHGLIPGAPRRKWGVFASGLVLSSSVILILELVLIAVMLILAIAWSSLNPGLAGQLRVLATGVQTSRGNLTGIIDLVVPFLLNPGILFLIFAFISVIVPLVEETLKPLGVWFLFAQKISPAQGFAYGVLSGAGFGLFENLGNTSGGADGWALLAASRISTVMLHCFTAGLVGWALASAWSERRYIRLAVTYAIAVTTHGLWNGMAMMSAGASLQTLTDIKLPAAWMPVGALAALGVIFLAVTVLVLYIIANALLRHYLPAPAVIPPGTGQSTALREENPPALEVEPSPPSSQLSDPSPSPADEHAPSPDAGSQDRATDENHPNTTESSP